MEQFRNDSETGIFEYSKSLESLLLSAQILRWDAEHKDITYDAGLLMETFEPYWEGLETYGSCFSDFQQRRRLYLTE